MKKLTAPLAALALLALVAGRADAVTLSLEPAFQVAAPPDTVFVDLVVSGLGPFAPPSLGDFDIDIGFDPGALTFVGYALHPFLGIPGPEAADFSLGEFLPGLINLAEVSLLEADGITCIFCIPPFLDDIQPDAFPLATLEFMVHTLPPGGATVVGIAGVHALGDGFGLPLPIDALLPALIVNEARLPEPMTALLVALGVLGLAARRRVRG